MPELYILRHGIAEPRQRGGTDADRALTEEGRRKLALVLAQAQRAQVAPAVILSSPLKRALQTAEMALEALAPQARLVRTPALSPESSPEALWRELRKHAGAGPVLLASHEPLAGESVGYLLGAGSVLVDFKKGAMVCIDADMSADRPRGILLWMITPRVCRQAGE